MIDIISQNSKYCLPKYESILQAAGVRTAHQVSTNTNYTWKSQDVFCLKNSSALLCVLTVFTHWCKHFIHWLISCVLIGISHLEIINYRQNLQQFYFISTLVIFPKVAGAIWERESWYKYATVLGFYITSEHQGPHVRQHEWYPGYTLNTALLYS